MHASRLSAAQIAQIKLYGIEGAASASAVAQLYGCSPETVRRMWRGETHRKVVVAGEAARTPLVSAGEPSKEAREALERLGNLLKGEGT